MEKLCIVAIDTNEFIELSHITSDYVPPKNERDEFKNKIRDLKRLHEAGHCIFVLTPTVHSEILAVKDKLSQAVREKEEDFLKNHCKIYEPEDMVEYALEVNKLAQKYCDEGVMNTKIRHQKNGSENEEKIEKGFKDALAMAEATIIGLNLLTNNGKDFIFYDYDKYKQKDKVIDSQRAEDIESINAEMGYKYITNGGIKFVPRPYSTEEFLNSFKSGLFQGKAGIKKELGE